MWWIVAAVLVAGLVSVVLMLRHKGGEPRRYRSDMDNAAREIRKNAPGDIAMRGRGAP